MLNILEQLEKTARNYPEKMAFVDEERSCTYSQLVERSKRIAVPLAKK